VIAMRSLSAAELIRTWERGLCQAPVDRALTLLAAVSPEPQEELAKLSVGRRDARLLEVYEQHFGSTLAAFAECPQCQERLEYSVNTGDLARSGGKLEEAELALEVGEMSLQLRPPNSVDLSAVRECADVEIARRMLMERCIVNARCAERSISPGALSDSAVEQVAECLAKADPQAESLIDLACPACGHSWQLLFDIEWFLWAKLNSLAKRLLREVHVLAEAYGWTERDILALTAVRRQFYLERVE